MTQKLNNAEGGTNGVTATTANTGGTSGDAFDTISNATGGGVTFSSGSAADGFLGYKMDAGTSGNSYAAWIDATPADSYSIQCAWSFDATPGATYQGPILIRTSADGTLVRLQQTTSRTITINGFTLTSSASAALTAAQVLWLDMAGSGLNTASGAHHLDVYNFATAALITSADLTGDTSAALAARVRFGNASTVAGFVQRFDLMRANIGSSALFGPPTFTAPSGLTATTISSTEIDLAWDVVPSATSYDVYRNGIIVANVTSGTAYADTGLTPATTYNYQVKAVK